MLKHSLKFFLLLGALILNAGCSDSSQPNEGEHFTKLPVDISAINPAPLIEVFSLTCSHCRNLEQMLPALEKASGHEITQVHVTFNQSARVAAVIYYSAVMQLNQAPDVEMMRKLFSAIQARDLTPEQRQAAVSEAFTERDLISPYELGEESYATVSELVSSAAQLTEQAEINAVPTFIVGGKYEILLANHDDIDDAANTIKFLLSQE